MKIRIFYRLENNIYRVSVHTEDWSENDIRLMERFGEPEINIGGEIVYERPEDSPVSVVLDDCWRRIKSEPISVSFDSRDTTYAQEFANAWADKIVGDISSAHASLHAHIDDFTREVVHTLNSF